MLVEEKCRSVETVEKEPPFAIIRSGERQPHRAFGSAYFLELGLSCQQLEQNIPALFTDPACGHVLRAKGFVQDENGWVKLNATADGLTANAIPKGQEVLIVIGEGLEKERIEARLKG